MLPEVESRARPGCRWSRCELDCRARRAADRSASRAPRPPGPDDGVSVRLLDHLAQPWPGRTTNHAVCPGSRRSDRSGERRLPCSGAHGTSQRNGYAVRPPPARILPQLVVGRSNSSATSSASIVSGVHAEPPLKRRPRASRGRRGKVFPCHCPHRAAQNEDLFRSVNERIVELGETFAHVERLELVCESSDVACLAKFDASTTEYRSVRAVPTRRRRSRAVDPAIERVLLENDRYTIVENLGLAGDVAGQDSTDSTSRVRPAAGALTGVRERPPARRSAHDERAGSPGLRRAAAVEGGDRHLLALRSKNVEISLGKPLKRLALLC